LSNHADRQTDRQTGDNSDNNQVSTATYGCNIRGAGARSEQCSVKASNEQGSFINPDLKKNCQRVADQKLFVAASSRQAVLKTGKHAWKSLSWWTVGPAAGCRTKVEIGCSADTFCDFDGVGKLEWRVPNFVGQNYQLAIRYW